MTPQFHSPKKVADLLGVPKSTVLSAIASGELPAVRYNRRVIRVTATDAAAWYALKGGRVNSTKSTTSTTSAPANLEP